MVRTAGRRNRWGQAPPPPSDCPECPDCREPLAVCQPSARAPEILVGHCDRCGALYMVGHELAAAGPPPLVVLGRAGLMEAGVRMRDLAGRRLVVVEEEPARGAIGAAG